jgi:hypothetical protein
LIGCVMLQRVKQRLAPQGACSPSQARREIESSTASPERKRLVSVAKEVSVWRTVSP